MIRIKQNPTDLTIIEKLIIVKSKEKFTGAFSDDELLSKYTIYYDNNEIVSAMIGNATKAISKEKFKRSQTSFYLSSVSKKRCRKLCLQLH